MVRLAYLLRPILSKSEIGLQARQAAGSFGPSLVVILILVGWSLWIGLHAPKGPFDIETLIYLAVMRGLNEELTYRGLLLGIANKLSPGKPQFLGASLGWGVVVTALLFGLLHGLWIEPETGCPFPIFTSTSTKALSWRTIAHLKTLANTADFLRLGSGAPAF
jgi:membrane protease YdiL (CAAX protease family)